MNKRTKFSLLNWGILTSLFLLFLNWHGTFEGPLSSQEIDMYMDKLQKLYPDEDVNNPTDEPSLREFLEADDGKPFVMVNATQYRDTTIAVNGQSFSETGEDATNEYASYVIGYLLQRGSYPVFTGEANFETFESWGIDNVSEWSDATLMRYRSRRVFAEMSVNPDFHLERDAKVAGVEKTFAYPTTVRIHLVDLGWVVGLGLLSIGLAMQLIIDRRTLLKPNSTDAIKRIQPA
ncbi:MAG: hypothetical protein AAGD96_13070 [Chloroflexota bacterium]